MRRSIRGSTVRLKHLNASGQWPSGNVRYYYRPKGRKGVPLPDLPPDHPKFLAAYAEAAGDAPRAPVTSGSIAAAVAAYKASPAFLLLASGTRAARRPMLDEIAERYGHARAAGLTARHIAADLDRREGHARNNRLRAWKGLGKFMAEKRITSGDPTAGLRKVAVAKSDGRAPWTLADIAAFRARWQIGTIERLAMELIYWTGARIGDAASLGPQHVDRDGWLAFRQGKTGGEVFVPFSRDLPDFADGFAADLSHLHAAIKARSVQHLTWLHTLQGASRSTKAVSQWFAAKARAAGIEGKTAHGLRKSRAEKLMEAGATEAQGMAWIGHADSRMLAYYAKKHSRKRALSRTSAERKVPTGLIPVPTSRR
jgi:integrase